MSEQPPIEFGKRRPVTSLPPEPPPKRSRHVALLLMGTMAVGGSAYGLMPKGTCEPASPAMATPALPPSDASCTAHGSSTGGGYGRSSHFSFFGGDSSSRASSTTTSDASSGGVTRGGFGSFARAFGFSARS